MSRYEERKQARIERYQELAQKADKEASNRFNSINIKTVGGMMGEPVKVGHHSEGRHRALLRRADKDMEMGARAYDKAEYYRQKAESAKNNTAISSDDENALTKLYAKLEKAKEIHEAMKEHNKKARKEGGEQYAPYTLQNSNARMRQTKQRIAKLEKIAQQKAENQGRNKSEVINGVEIVENYEENRLQLLFDGKPDEEIRTKLKNYGFRWSRYHKAWQRQLTDNARRYAKYILENI